MPRKPKRRTWGTGSICERDGRWWIRWTEGGRRRAKSFGSKELATGVLLKITSDIARGDAGLRPDYAEAPNLEALAKPWLERRKATHRSAIDDRHRWNNHLCPAFGTMKPHEVNAAKLRQFIEDKLAKGLAPASVNRCLGVLSTFYADIIEQGHAPSNPVASLPRSAQRLVRNYDTRATPFKDDEPRLVPLLTSLAPILAAWKLKTGGEGLLFKPAPHRGGGRPDIGSDPTYIRPHTLAKHLNKALVKCELPKITWYQSTRHTFASQFVLGGGGIELLSKIMGHASITTTEIYSHLRHDLFAEKAFDAVTVDLARPAGDVVSISRSSGPLGHTMGTAQADNEERKLA
jgi:hypothetical protein